MTWRYGVGHSLFVMSGKAVQLRLPLAHPHAGPGVSEVGARSVLTPSRLADYTVNAYTGCGHGCVYCYARRFSRSSHPGEQWGTFVDVKVNAPQVLEREAARRGRGLVFLSSATDGWQPLEERYRLTRGCLEVLLEHGFAVHVQTKSALVQRDYDLLAGRRAVVVGITITTLDPGVAALFEPGASPPGDRVAAVERARSMGIDTTVFLGPLLPYISDRGQGLGRLLDAVAAARPQRVIVDRLNPRFGMWPGVVCALERCHPELVPLYREVLYDGQARARYSADLRRRITFEAGRRGLGERLQLCF